MRPYHIILLFIAALSVGSQAQDCGTLLSPEEVVIISQRQESGGYELHERIETDYVVHVAFHIVQTDVGTGGLPQVDLDWGFDNCNHYYEETGIQYVLVEQDTILSNDWFFIEDNGELVDLKLTRQTPGVIDVFFVEGMEIDGQGLCGISSFSTSIFQGIVMVNDCMIRNSVLAHEIGHYFDLYHTHETIFGHECPDGSDCDSEGDLVCDTAADPRLSGDNVGGRCNYTGAENTNCNGSLQVYDPDPANIMSYSYKECRDTFTPGQSTRILASLINWRSDHIHLAPDLMHTAPFRWTASLTPRSDTEATESNCPASATLVGNSNNTWINLAVYNASDGSAPPYRAHVLVDNTLVTNLAFEGNSPRDWSKQTNVGPFWVSGGRHALRDSLDPDDELDELSETNNTYWRQWVWSPLELEADGSRFTAAPPDPMDDFFSSQNCVGFQFTSGSGWDVISMLPASADANYQVRLHQDYTGSTEGFEDVLAQSIHYAGNPDWVLVNGNLTGSQSWQVGVTNASLTSDMMVVERSHSSQFQMADGSYTMGALLANQTADVFELIVGAADLGVPWQIDMNSTDTGDLDMTLYHTTMEYGGRNDGVHAHSVVPGVTNQSLACEFNQSGSYALVVYKANHAERTRTISYTLDIASGNPDLQPEIILNTTRILSPRNPDTECGVFDSWIDEGDTRLDVGFINAGAIAAVPGWQINTYLNGVLTDSDLGAGYTLNPETDSYECDFMLGSVMGGRHEVGAWLDATNLINEGPNESNNKYYTQLTWTWPHLMDQHPLHRPAAPNFRNLDNPGYDTMPGNNQHGYTAEAIYWTAFAATPHSEDDRLRAFGYDHHALPHQEAFLNWETSSTGEQGQTVLVMMNGNQISNGQLRDFGVCNPLFWPDHPSSTGYTVQSCERIADVHIDVTQEERTIGAGEIVHAFDIYLEAGLQTPYSLGNYGPADLALAFFEPEESHISLENAYSLRNENGPGDGECGAITPPVSGWYGLAIYKADNTGLGEDCDYRFHLGALQPMPITDLEILPDPEGEDHFILQFGRPLSADGLPVFVTQYDIYRSPSALLPFVDWQSAGGTIGNQFSLTYLPAGDMWFYRIVARGPGDVPARALPGVQSRNHRATPDGKTSANRLAAHPKASGSVGDVGNK